MRTLILMLCCLSWSAFAGEVEMVEVPAHANRFSIGTGFEGRSREQVNPDNREGKFMPHFFAQYRYDAFGASLEGSYQQGDSQSGALNIETRTYQLGLWGRYEFGRPLHWSPFLGAGAGYLFDQVTSKYLGESDERSGRRGFLGLGGGVSHEAWKHVLLESELRAAFIQDRKDVAYSLLFRIGYVL